jgi:hypothetical protein
MSVAVRRRVQAIAASPTWSPVLARPSRRIRRRPQDRFQVPNTVSTRHRRRGPRALCAVSRARSRASASGLPQPPVCTTFGTPPRDDDALDRAAGKGTVAVDRAGLRRQHRLHLLGFMHSRGGDLDGADRHRGLVGRPMRLVAMRRRPPAMDRPVGGQQRQGRPAGLALRRRREADQMTIDLRPVDQPGTLRQRPRPPRLRPRQTILLTKPTPCHPRLGHQRTAATQTPPRRRNPARAQGS